jgi:hypothetical protein
VPSMQQHHHPRRARSKSDSSSNLWAVGAQAQAELMLLDEQPVRTASEAAASSRTRSASADHGGGGTPPSRRWVWCTPGLTTKLPTSSTKRPRASTNIEHQTPINLNLSPNTYHRTPTPVACRPLLSIKVVSPDIAYHQCGGLPFLCCTTQPPTRLHHRSGFGSGRFGVWLVMSAFHPPHSHTHAHTNIRRNQETA